MRSLVRGSLMRNSSYVAGATATRVRSGRKIRTLHPRDVTTFAPARATRPPPENRSCAFDPVALSGKRGWDVIHFRSEADARMPAQSSRENDVHTSPDDNAFTDDERHARWEEQERAASSAVRDIADVAAVEIITTTAVHLSLIHI